MSYNIGLYMYFNQLHQYIEHDLSLNLSIIATFYSLYFDVFDGICSLFEM